MFDIEKWQEIFSAMRKNKLRTILTGFSVAWGIFMLIVLLGFGTGLQNGVEKEFKQDAVNSIWISPGQTSKAYKGYKPGRRIRFTNSDYYTLKNNVNDIEYISARFHIRGNKTISYKQNYGSFSIVSAHPDYKQIEAATMVRGRFVNNKDIKRFRKVAVIGEPVEKQLFKKGNHKKNDDNKDIKHNNERKEETVEKEECIGKYIKIDNIPFKVVGVFTDANKRDLERIYIPISTSQRVFGGGNDIHRLTITTNASAERSEEMVKEIREKYASIHKFDKEDDRAIFIWNTLKEFKKFQGLFTGIRAFVWVIGIFTLIAGVVGVSNIMMIVVKDRTKEMGIRKAIGATPRSVINLIVAEAILITSFAGYIGLILGVMLLEGISNILPPDAPFFANPEINIKVAIWAIGVLIVSGALAGFFPALRAAAIKPIEALRDE